MEFDDVMRARLARLRNPEDPLSAAMEGAIAQVYAKPNQRVRADWFLEPDSDIGVHLHCVPAKADDLPRMQSVLRHQRAARNLHDHDFFELAYLHSGSATHRHEEGSEDLRAGHVLFVTPGFLHDLELSPGSVVVTLILRTDLLGQSIWAALPHARIFSDCISEYQHSGLEAGRFLSLPVGAQDDPDRVKAMVEGIVLEDVERKAGWSAVCESHLVALFTILGRSASTAIDDGGTEKKGEELVHAVLRWTQNNYAEVTLAQLSQRFSYSPSHISRLVRRHTGRNLADIVRDVRLETAAELLSGSTLAVHEVARSVGFASTSHLHKVFRKRYGMSPAEFRQRVE